MRNNKRIGLLSVLAILLVILFVFDLKESGKSINIIATINAYMEGNTDSSCIVLFNIRLPRVITAMLTGASLAVSGGIMQIVFRNPLAGPYVLGVSSGASLGVAIVTMLASLSGLSIYMLGNWTVGVIAIVGALSVMLAIVTLSKKITDSTTILIIGVLFASLTNAIISIIQYFSNPDSLKLFVNWSLGSLNAVTWSQLYILIPISVLCTIATLLLSKQLDAMLLGEIYASTMGIKVKRLRNYCIVLTSILAGLTTAFTGPISFIGIAIPHLTRGLLNTTKHIYIIPGSILNGAIILLFCDLLSQITHNGYTLPINAICAIVGAPIVTYVILKNKRR